MLRMATPPKICVMEKIGDAADQQGDDEEQPAQQRAEDDLAVGQRRGEQDVVGLAVLLLGDGAGGEDRRQQGDQAELEVAHLLEDLAAGLGQVAEVGAAGAGAAGERWRTSTSPTSRPR